VGYQGFDGVRKSGTNKTYKDNQAWFISGQTFHGPLTLSGGLRRETVEYQYRPNAGASLRDEHTLRAWDLGANFKLDDRWSIFANFNRAYQAPDVDRFFTWGGGFNAFIAPAMARTVNVGMHHVLPTNRLQLTLFRVNLENEIYYNGSTFSNTNIDKSHKYGLELQNQWRASDSVTLSGKYAYVRAVIDRESDAGGTFNDKNLPGVPRHSVNLGAQWRVGERTRVSLSQVWRSEAYSADDFANTRQQKQRAYASTDVSLNYRYGKVDFFAGVENLFDRANGIWVRDDRIYPVNFERSWKLGVQANF
jgi:iron complex outermembrane receptor protein